MPDSPEREAPSTIWEGYAAAKLFKAGFRSNYIDPNARHCMASAVAGFMRTFGMDAPMGRFSTLPSSGWRKKCAVAVRKVPGGMR